MRMVINPPYCVFIMFNENSKANKGTDEVRNCLIVI